MVSMHELKLGAQKLEALKFLLESIGELNEILKTLNFQKLTENKEIITQSLTQVLSAKADIEQIRQNVNNALNQSNENTAQIRLKGEQILQALNTIEAIKTNMQSLSEQSLNEINSLKSQINQDARQTQEAKNQITSKIDEITPSLNKFDTAFDELMSLKDSAAQAKTARDEITQKATQLNTLANEIRALKSDIQAIIDATGLINDESTGVNTTYSSTKIDEKITAAKSELSQALNSKAGASELSQLSERVNQEVSSVLANTNQTITELNRSNSAYHQSIKLFKRGIKPEGIGDEINAITQSPYYRIPAMTITSSGAVIVLSDYRKEPSDQVKIGIVSAVSLNGGKDWKYYYAIKPYGDNANARVMDSTILAHNDTIFILNGAWLGGGVNWTRDNWANFKLVLTTANATDGYSTYTQRELSINGMPQGIKGIVGGVGSGLVLNNRLIFPIQYTTGANVKAGAIYSDDNGTSWSWANISGADGISENNLYRLKNGALAMFGRKDGSGIRASSPLLSNNEPTDDIAGANLSYDISRTKDNPLRAKIGERQGTQGSTISFITRAGVYVILFSRVQNRTGGYNRDRITLYATSNGAGCVPLANLNYDKGGVKNNIPYGGYSCLAYANNADGESLAIAVEEGLGIRYINLNHLLPVIDTLFANSNDDLIASYEAVNFSPLGWASKTAMPAIEVSKDIMLDSTHKDLVAINSTSANLSAPFNERRKISKALYLQLKGEQALAINELSLIFDAIIPTQESWGDSWCWLVQISDYGQNLNGSGNAPFYGLGFEKITNATGNIKFNPIKPGAAMANRTQTFISNIKPNTKHQYAICIRKNATGYEAEYYIDGASAYKFENCENITPDRFRAICFGNESAFKKKQKTLIGNIKIYSRGLSTDEVLEYYAKSKGANQAINELRDDINSSLQAKADKTEVATAKSEINAMLEAKANASDLTELNNRLLNVDNTHDIDKPISTAVRAALEAKANKEDLQTKANLDEFLSLKDRINQIPADIFQIRTGTVSTPGAARMARVVFSTAFPKACIAVFTNYSEQTLTGRENSTINTGRFLFNNIVANADRAGFIGLSSDKRYLAIGY